MVDRLRFLVLCAYFPWHGHGGGVIVGNLIRQLAREHSVTILTYCLPEEVRYQSELQLPSTVLHWVEAPDHNTTENNQHVESASRGSKLGFVRKSWRKIPHPVRSGVNRVRWFLQQISHYNQRSCPTEIARLQLPVFQEKLQAILRTHSFDIVLSEWPEMGYYGLLGDNEMLRVLDTIEMRSQSYEREIENSTSFDGKLLSWLEWKKMRAFEKKMCDQYEIVTTVSTREASLFKEYNGKAAILHNPIGLELDRYLFVGQEYRNPNHILFLGNMAYGPNRDAVNYFLDRIFPRIRGQLPDVQLYIVGNAPSQDLLERSGSDGVYVTGYVPDVNHFLSKSGVFILPMRQGAGIKIKALEAMAVGVPVVSTPEGMEGIEISDECYLGKTDQDFAEKVIRLTKDIQLRQVMAEKARTLIVDRYDCRKNIATLVDKYQKFLAVKRHAPN